MEFAEAAELPSQVDDVVLSKLWLVPVWAWRDVADLGWDRR